MLQYTVAQQLENEKSDLYDVVVICSGKEENKNGIFLFLSTCRNKFLDCN